jgi:hypothetical protein
MLEAGAEGEQKGGEERSEEKGQGMMANQSEGYQEPNACEGQSEVRNGKCRDILRDAGLRL